MMLPHLTHPARSSHAIGYMVAYPLIFGELTAESYTDERAADPRIDALRAKIHCVEDTRFSSEYHDPDKRSIGNALRVELADGTALDEVVVTGYRKSLEDSLEVKRNSELVVEAVTGGDIGALPDVTIAESLVRLPGINGTRDRGNQSQATLRGLGPRLVLGLVNGREVASSEPSRNVRWEIYPS